MKALRRALAFAAAFALCAIAMPSVALAAEPTIIEVGTSTTVNPYSWTENVLPLP